MAFALGDRQTDRQMLTSRHSAARAGMGWGQHPAPSPGQCRSSIPAAPCPQPPPCRGQLSETPALSPRLSWGTWVLSPTAPPRWGARSMDFTPKHQSRDPAPALQRVNTHQRPPPALSSPGQAQPGQGAPKQLLPRLGYKKPRSYCWCPRALWGQAGCSVEEPRVMCWGCMSTPTAW